MHGRASSWKNLLERERFPYFEWYHGKGLAGEGEGKGAADFLYAIMCELFRGSKWKKSFRIWGNKEAKTLPG